MTDFSSPYYPYEKVNEGYNSFDGAELIPYQILSYLMDMEDAHGYVPVDDNARPRVRLMKYLYHDGANPLAQPLPTGAEKRSILFDANEPVLNTDEQKAKHPKGYRLFAQQYWQQAELTAKTILKCYVGRVIPYSPFQASIGLIFEICTFYGWDAATKTTAYSKLYAMECALLAALHGVNITGVGVVNFDRRMHIDAGSQPYRDDGSHLYRVVKMSIDWMESKSEGIVSACR